MSDARIRLELTPPVLACLPGGPESLAERVVDGLRTLAHRLGIPQWPGVEVAGSERDRAVRIVLAGRAVEYPLTLLRRTWLAVAPDDLRDLPLRDFDPATDAADGWLIRLARTRTDDEAVESYIAALVVEAFALHPATLLTEAAAVAYFEETLAAGLPPADALTVLSELLELGVSLRARDLVGTLVRGRRDADGSLEDCVEEAFVRLDRHVLEVFVHPELFAAQDGAITGEPVSIEDPRLPGDLRSFGAAAGRHLLELGINRPLVLFGDADLPRDCIRVRINDRLGALLPVPGPGEVAVQVAPSVLAEKGMSGRLLADAASGHRLVAVPADERERLRALGFNPLTHGAFMAVAVAREVTSMADRLLTVEDVEHDLADLEDTHPDLVHTALRQLSATRITRVLRGLLREHASSRDLWAILNALLRYEDVATPEPGLRLFDPRLPVRHPGLPLEQVATDDLVGFVRVQMSRRVAYDAGMRRADRADSSLSVYELEPAAGIWLRERVDTGGPSEAEADAIRQQVGRLLSHAGAAADSIILTPPDVRVALRDVLEPRFPSVRILSTSEVPSSAAVQVRRRIALGASATAP